MPHLWPIGGGQQQYSWASLKAIQLRQQLIQSLITLFICSNAAAPTWEDSRHQPQAFSHSAS